MVRLNISHMLALHGIRHGRSYLINQGYTPDEVRGLLGNALKEMRFAMLTRLCITFKCLPNDLLNWDGEADCHLSGLNKPPVPDIEKLLEGKTPQEIEAIMRRLGGA